MKQYKLWDRQEYINGVEPQYFLNQPPFKNYEGDIILIYSNNRVLNVECKDILAEIYEIDKNLSLDLFMAEYFTKIEQE